MSMTHHFLILKSIPPTRLLTHLPYKSEELLLGFLLPHSTQNSCGFFFVVFYFFPHLGKPSVEYLPLARALAIGQPYASSTIFLASLYQAMGKYVTEAPYLRIGEALWFIQIWLFAYFPDLSCVDSFPSMSLRLSVA